MSAQIRQACDSYYAILEQIQKGTLDTTPGMEWFFACTTQGGRSTSYELTNPAHEPQGNGAEAFRLLPTLSFRRFAL